MARNGFKLYVVVRGLLGVLSYATFEVAVPVVSIVVMLLQQGLQRVSVEFLDKLLLCQSALELAAFRLPVGAVNPRVLVVNLP